MKKKLLIISLTFVLFCASLLFIGCGTSKLNVENNISDFRIGVFDGKNDSFFASFIYGKREEPYSEDGISNTNVDFGIISVKFNKKQTKTTFPFKLTIGNKTIEGELEKSPFTNEFMADIGKQITSEDPISLTISLNSEEITLNLDKKSTNWEIDANSALEIGKKSLKEEITNLQKIGSCEFYLKIISDSNIAEGKYFWAFSAVCNDGTKHNVVFSTDSDEILVKN